MEFKTVTVDSGSIDPDGTESERRAEIRADYRLMCLQDLRGAEFLGLLHLAHTEGLLAELMQAAGCVASPAETLRCLSGELNAGQSE
jgi:hypothetical protein